MVTIMYNFFGVVFVLLGALGIFLPLLPTTPFLLLALMCFTKSSNKLYLWLIDHKILGKYISNWERHRVIPVTSKVLATVMIFSSSLILLHSDSIDFSVSIALSACLLMVLAYLWHFPSTVQSITPPEGTNHKPLPETQLRCE